MPTWLLAVSSLKWRFQGLIKTWLHLLVFSHPSWECLYFSLDVNSSKDLPEAVPSILPLTVP